MTAAWTTAPYDLAAARRLETDLGLGHASATILVRRGCADPDAARAFLAADRRTAAADLPGAGPACEVILRHVRAGSRILVFGDYDVDGITSTAMMVRTLRTLGADPAWQLPDRADGYGLNTHLVERIAGSGVRLLVTVDCGIGSAAEVARARELGMEVVVTDHHRPPERLPDCPIVHPALGPLGAEGPAGELCAAGVVLKLSEALRDAAGIDPAGAEQDLDLAGLGTICDMVPLRDENRRIAREGVAAIAGSSKPGLRALMGVAALQPADVDAGAVGFRLGPRLNAAGRMQRADAALELLLTDDAERAAEIAGELDLLNRDRREAEQRILWEAEAACAPQLAAATLVVAGEGWHPGVVGIVASRLVERFRRPAVVVALDGEGGGRGSGRSIGAYDLHAGLTACASVLRRFGGHRMAAGLEIDAEGVGALRSALAAHAGSALSPADLRPVHRVDAVVATADLSLGTAEDLDRLGPFGAGNPAPVLLVPAARIEHVTAMGEGGVHSRFSLAGGGARARGVAFGRSQRSLAAAGGAPQDVALRLERNRYNGAVEARVVLRDLCPAVAGALAPIGVEDFWVAAGRELDADPAAAGVGAARSARALYDWRGTGVAAVAADVITSGAAVLAVVADIPRRREGLERTVAGIGRDPLAVVEWRRLLDNPGLAAGFEHLLLVDPPPLPDAIEALGGHGGIHMAWGEPEAEFTLSVWRHELTVRPALEDLWRALAAEGTLSADGVERALRGTGDHPRPAALAGRALRVLTELSLIDIDRETHAVRRISSAPTALERSPAYRAYAGRLAAIEAHLGTPDAMAAAA